MTEDLGIDLILIADDLAYSSGLYFSPLIFAELVKPYYHTLADQISRTQAAAGWHSDGNVSAILPDLVDCGWRFFHLESECVDLLSFKRTHGSRVTLIGGIRTASLTQQILDPTRQRQNLEEIRMLVEERGLIMASSCGLYDPKFLPALREIYQLVETISCS